jgi:hypothetical protein
MRLKQRPKEELQKEQEKIEEIAELLCWEKKYEKGDLAIWKKRINTHSCPKSQNTIDPPLAYEAINPDDSWYKIEDSVLHLKDQINVISTDSDARLKARELEKDYLLSQILAARHETQVVTEDKQIAEQGWIADKESLMSSLCRFEREVEEMSKVLLQCRAAKNDLESELTETKKRTQELLQKFEQDPHLWDDEKRNSEGTLAELQTKLELMAREKRLQNHINEDLSTKLLSLKDQLREYNAKLVYMEDGRQMLNARSASNAESLESMITNAKIHYANASSTWY